MATAEKNSDEQITIKEQYSALQEKHSFVSKKLLVILIAITVIAFLFAINGLGKNHLSPFCTSITTENPASMAFSKNGGAIIDSQNKRLCFTDSNKKVKSIASTNETECPVDEFTEVAIYGNTIYASGFQAFDKGCYISSEKILKYDLNGKYLGELFYEEHPESEIVTNPTIKGLSVNSEGLFATKTNGNKLEVKKISENRTEDVASFDCPFQVFDANYSSNENYMCLTDYAQKFYVVDCSNNSVTPITFNQFLSMGFSPEIANDTFFQQLDNAGVYSFQATYAEDDQLENMVVVNMQDVTAKVFYDGGSLDVPGQFDLDTLYMIHNVLFWISCVWLGLIGLAILLWLIKNKLKAKGRVFIGALVLLLFVCVYYSSSNFNMIEKTYKDQLATQSKQISILVNNKMQSDNSSANLSGNSISSAIVGNMASGNYNSQEYEVVQRELNQLCAANGVDKGMYVVIYSVQNNECYKAYLDSRGVIPPGLDVTYQLGEIGALDAVKNVETSSDSTGAMSTDTIKVGTTYYTQLASYAGIYDQSGNKVALVSACAYEDSLISESINTCLNLFINLAAILTTLFVAILALMAIFEDLKKYFAMKKANDPNRSVMLNGSYQMLYRLMSNMDAALQVYVAQSMCQGVDMATMAMLVAVPSATYYLGKWIGSMACPILFAKLSKRTVSVIGSVGCIAAYAVMIVSVGFSSIAIYSIGKLFQGIFAQGVMYMLGDNIPFLAQDKETRNQAILSSQKASIASSVVATLVGGYLGQYLSYAAIYAVSVLFAVLILFLCFMIFDSGCVGGRPQSGAKGSAKQVWALFLKPTLIVYVVCALFSRILLSGYSSYLFPLFTSGVGISAVLLSNISVFSTVVNYFSSGPLNRFCDKFKNTWAISAMLIIAGASLVCFLVSPSIWWAIIVLFILGVIGSSMGVRYKKFIADYAEEVGEDPASIQTDSNVIFSFLMTLNSPILAGLASIGLTIGCAILGAITAVNGVVFGVFNKNRGVSKKE